MDNRGLEDGQWHDLGTRAGASPAWGRPELPGWNLNALRVSAQWRDGSKNRRLKLVMVPFGGS